jgi:hypothetical protein
MGVEEVFNLIPNEKIDYGSGFWSLTLVLSVIPRGARRSVKMVGLGHCTVIIYKIAQKQWIYTLPF